MPEMRPLPRPIDKASWAIFAGWCAVGAWLIPQARHAEKTFEVAVRLPGSESAAVDEALRTRFHSPFAQTAIAVVTGVPAPPDPRGMALLRDLVAASRAVRGAGRTYSYLDVPDPYFAGTGGTGTFFALGLDTAAEPIDALVPRLREATATVVARWRGEFPSAAVSWTGQGPLNLDLRRTGASDVRRAERRALPITLALLLVAFRSVAAAAIPLAAGGLAIALSLGAAVCLGRLWPLSASLQSIVSMLGLGLGIDYALLAVSRFREARAAGLTPAEAAEEVRRHAGRTIALSGGVVAIGFVGLVAAPLGELRSMAVGGLLVVAFSVLISTTLLPPVLTALGSRLEAGGLGPRLDGQRRWRSWGGWVTARPRLVLMLAAVPVLALAAPAARMRIGLPAGNWLPPSMESARGVAALEAMGRGGLVQSVRILLELPPEAPALSRAAWDAEGRLVARLRADARVARVQSLWTVAGDRAGDLAFASLIPGAVKRAFVSEEADAVLIEVVPRLGLAPEESTRLVQDLRGADAATVTGLAGTRMRVGGLAGSNVDYRQTIVRFLPLEVLLVVVATFASLCLAFRSVLVPAKAVGLNILSVAAACGALVLVIQEGHGAAWLGISGPTAAVFPAVPALLFSIVFGLSMDYEVFLISRVAELRRAGSGDTAALAEALARTGRTITSAAVIMVVVFIAFAGGEFLLMKMLGFALAVAVLVDATVLRIALGPALLQLAGRWNWWPGERSRTAATPPSRAHAGMPG